MSETLQTNQYSSGQIAVLMNSFDEQGAAAPADASIHKGVLQEIRQHTSRCAAVSLSGLFQSPCHG